MLPPLAQEETPREYASIPNIEAERRDLLAAMWRNNGLTEHASVAAFSRLALELMALGAPTSLVAAAHRDALDEVRHAHLCFSLANAIDGRSLKAGALNTPASNRFASRVRLLALTKLALESLMEGALLEGVSARVIANLATRCEIPEIKSILKGLAVDEARHATHGWDVVVWCLNEGGLPVLYALKAAMKHWPETFNSEHSSRSRAFAWEAYGIPSGEIEQAEYAQVCRDLKMQVDALTFAVA